MCSEIFRSVATLYTHVSSYILSNLKIGCEWVEGFAKADTFYAITV